MKLSVRLFVRLLNALYALDDILSVDIFNINCGGVADESEHGGLNAVPFVDPDIIIAFELFGKFMKLFLGCGWF